MYRSEQGEGEAVGGPMYYITVGLGKHWKPLAIFFAVAGLFATIPAFQTNQLVQTIVDVFALGGAGVMRSKLMRVLVLTALVGLVTFGGIRRIGAVTARLVPLMVGIHFIIIPSILILKHQDIPAIFTLILRDAFALKPLVGGALGAVIITGVRCLGYLTNRKTAEYYKYFYVAPILFSAVIKLETAVDLIDSAFALMSIPTLTGALMLAPKVKAEMKRYLKPDHRKVPVEQNPS